MEQNYGSDTIKKMDDLNEWVYFLLVKNKSMSGEDILIDNGEKNLNCTFVWPNF